MGFKHRHDVKSSNVRSIAYDIANRLLEVNYHTGGSYEYENVTPEQWAYLMNAESVGRWLITNIKMHPEAHPYRRKKEM